MIRLIVPMSGQGTRFLQAGYAQPKPLIPVSGVPMIERLLNNFPTNWATDFILAENHRSTNLPAILERARPGARFTYIAPHKQGPSFAVHSVLSRIPPEDPILISYCDYAMAWDSSQFQSFVMNSECDACVVSYRGFHAHYLEPNQYAYSRMDGERVIEVREKGSFTENRESEFASCGAYYFRSAEVFKRAYEWQVANQLSLNGEYYTSLTVDALLKAMPNAHVRVFEIPGFYQWGTPRDVRTCEYWEKTFRAFNKHVCNRPAVDQVLMPMAGLGSRFSPLTSIPKPLIPIAGRPMYQSALDSLPSAKKTCIVTLNSVARAMPKQGDDVIVVSLSETPPGQALSTEAGIPALDTEGDIIISSCDHAIVLDPGLWQAFRANPACDAAVFTVRNYPGAHRSPRSFSYVASAGSEQFPTVERVSLKQPVSENPEADDLLVGTFWFRSVKVLSEGISALKESHPHTGGELYLDKIFDVLRARGKISRVIRLDGYICWGDQNSLAESLYWQELLCGHRVDFRPKFPGLCVD